MRFYNAKTILTKPHPAYLVINIFSQQDSLFADVFFFFFPVNMYFYERALESRVERLAGGMRTCFFTVRARALACLKH